MKTYLTGQIKNIVLLGGSASGKTTLAEAMMFEGKVIDRRGSVDAKNTVSDYTEVEQLYKRSIYSTLLYTEFKEHKLNIIDTPGADDFVSGVASAMKVADTCVMVINAQAGVEIGTQTTGRWADRAKKPMVIAVNQLDSEKANWESTIDSLKQSFGNRVTIMQYPLVTGQDFNGFVDVLTMKYYTFKDDNGTREEHEIPAAEKERAAEYHNTLAEAAAEHDESLMEIYFDKGELTEDEIRKGLSIGIKSRSTFPVLCTSGKRDIGTKRLMEFVIKTAPYPDEGASFDTETDENVPCKADGPTSLFVFKTSVEPHIGEVSYFRVISGKVTEGMDLINASNDSKERISGLFSAAGKKREKQNEMLAGDIGCTVKLKNTKTNQTLNSPGIDRKLKAIQFPEPKFRTAVKAKNEADDEKLSELLNRAHNEDPTLIVEYSKELKQLILSGQGEHHINILKWHLSNSNKIEIELFAPKIPYRETITKVAAADYRHKKQSGGAGQFGEVHIVIEPHVEEAADTVNFKTGGKEIRLNIKGREEISLDWGGKLIYYNCIVGGAIDARFMPAILKGVMDKMEEGPLTGSYARDIRVAVYDGKMHPVDSNELSFRLAGRNAFKEAFKKAGPKIMEPIYNVKIYVPSEHMGDVMSDMQNRRAIIEGMDSEAGFEIIKARVPLAEMYKYSTTLSSLTSGSATFSMKFADYQQVPADVQEKLLKAYEDQEKEE
ncbi:MAG: elongation factor G [Prevotellaceae bacterium]|jgi:elongation factor G|nr:elongation factor G [Prevotellaceae bacterium]